MLSLSCSNAPFFVLLLASAVRRVDAVAAATDDLAHTLSTLPRCPDFLRYVLPVEHSDSACDRVAANDPSFRQERMRIMDSLSTAEKLRVPEEKTWTCPQEEDFSFAEDLQGVGTGKVQVGPPSKWLVRNAASVPVVVSWLDTHAGREVSAMNPDIVPPHHDPDAILEPGMYGAIRGFQGHVFYVRELLPTASGELVPGRVLLRHRPGNKVVRNRSGIQLDCASDLLARGDPAPLVEGADEEPVALAEEFQRTPENFNELCNVQHVSFVNRVGCPVDVYWAGGAGCAPEDMEGGTCVGIGSTTDDEAEQDRLNDEAASPVNAVDANHTDTSDGARMGKHTYSKPSCDEKFKFHLGVNRHPANVDDWDSPIAYEGTYLTHRFVARLRSDPSVVVDEIVIEGSVVRDCPMRVRSDAGVRLAAAVAAEVEVRSELNIDLPDVANAYAVLSSNGTSVSLEGRDGTVTASM